MCINPDKFFFAITRCSSCFSMTALVVLITFSAVAALGLGAGLGYNKCYVDVRKHKAEPGPKGVIEYTTRQKVAATAAGANDATAAAGSSSEQASASESDGPPNSDSSPSG